MMPLALGCDHTLCRAELPPLSIAEQIMGMPREIARRWTRDQVIALIDASPLQTPRYEVVDEELLVTSSPTALHQRAVRELLIALSAFLDRTRVGEAFHAPFDVEVERGTLTQPDVFVVPPDEAERLLTELPARTLLLAVEVISASSARGDRGRKRELYQRSIPEYWIVDLDARLFERWLPEHDRPEVLRERLVWLPRGTGEAFALDVPRYFRKVFAEPS